MMVLDIVAGTARQTVQLSDYLDAASEERAQEDSYTWIKSVRAARIEGTPFRSRFTFRGDSLWWFAEIYLHKEQAILNLMRTVAAFDALIERERPRSIRLVEGKDDFVRTVASARRVPFETARTPASGRQAVARLDARARRLSLAARLSRLRGGGPSKHRARVAAFVHRAFWRADAGDGSAESYIGPVLLEIEHRVGRRGIQYIGVGPRKNFRARRWWQALSPANDGVMIPIERYASGAMLAASRDMWRQRQDIRRALWSSPDLRDRAVIRGCDFWNVVREQLAGIALLQFPWSARAMDEAAAALDAIEPDVAVTYAEAGGWGRALALECRRRGVPLAGLQHGFIYRHWLNYRHEADELLPDLVNSNDAGFPRPALTLLFDDYAARYLSDAGGFPPQSVKVTGSARLDELIAAVKRQGSSDIAATRTYAGVSPTQMLVVFAAKQREAAPYLDRLIAAVRGMPGVQLAIKPHPAETPDVYARAVGHADNVRVLSTAASLPALLAAARAIVTVNSTVALDALSLGVPSLVIGLPNNLTPFVDAGVMAGASSEDEIRLMLERLLYDEGFRRQLERASDDFLRRTRSEQGGGAAVRTAASVIALGDAARGRSGLD
jgi:Capsule polysaccharide biosynthesis protein